MQKTPNKKMIGLFTIFGIIIFVFLIFLFVGNKILSKNENEIVMYFDESVKGLSIGSSISFRGVEIGKVSKIDLVADTKNLNFSIPVYAILDKNQTFRIFNNGEVKNKEKFLKDLVGKGLKARLMTQSYLTGQLYVELEILPNIPIIFKGNNFYDNVIEIPTILSPLSEISKGFQDLPIRQILNNFNNLLINFDKSFPILFTNINKILLNDIENTTNNINKTLNELQNTFKTIRNFIDYLDRHPEALLKGKNGY